MISYLKRVLELVRPYRVRFGLGLLFGFLSGALAFTLPVSLKVAVDTVFTEKAGNNSQDHVFILPGTNGPKLLVFASNGTAAVVYRFDSQTAPTVAQAFAPSLGERFTAADVLGDSGFQAYSAPLGQETPTQIRQWTWRGTGYTSSGSSTLSNGLSSGKKAMRYGGSGSGSAKSNPAGVKLPGPLKQMLDNIQNWFRPHGVPTSGTKLLAIALIPAAMLLRGLLGYLNIYLLSWVGIRAANDLRERVFAHLLDLPVSFFNKTGTGDLLARVEGAMAVNTTVNGSFAIIIREPISIAVLAATLFALNAKLTLATLVVFPVCLVPVVIYGQKLRKSHSGIHDKFSNVSKVLVESFTATRVIKAYNLEKLKVGDYRRAIDGVTSFFMRSVRASEIPGPLIEFIGSIGVALVFIYFAFFAGQTSPGDVSDLLTFFIAVFGLYAPVKNLSRLQSQLTIARAGVDPAYDLLAVKSTLPEPAHPKPVQASGARISYENVTFAYDDKAPVLHKINLTIEPGQMVALVGMTGSGKTTLANLLLRFYDPLEGTVRIGGTDIREVNSRELRANIAVVSQETILFNETIRANIALGRPGAPEADIFEASKHAHAHDFIMEKPLAYETRAGEKGANLSGGQRQRITIARALLKNAPILVLDEAMSSLDTKTESAVQEALEELMKGRTTICIAHRLSTIQNADVIVVLDGGRIVETGTHEELLKKGGIYCRLHELGFKSPPTPPQEN